MTLAPWASQDPQTKMLFSWTKCHPWCPKFDNLVGWTLKMLCSRQRNRNQFYSSVTLAWCLQCNAGASAIVSYALHRLVMWEVCLWLKMKVFYPVHHCHSYTTVYLLLVLYTTPSSKEPLVCQFRCSISECNKQFVTQPICNASVCATSGGCYIWNVTLWWFTHAQSNNKTINI